VWGYTSGGSTGPLANPGSAEVLHDCADGLEPLAVGGCWSAPAVQPEGLVVYLHGLYPSATPAEELDRQARVAKLASAKKFATLALRGQEGECTNPERAAYVCWPSNERNATDADRFVAAWTPALEEARRRLGLGATAGRAVPRYVLGFSNGGYFAGLLATRGLFEAKAFAVAHAGPVEPVGAWPHGAASRPPILLLSADDDASQPDMVKFETELGRFGWQVETAVRDGGHALTDSDVDAALTFFVRATREGLPLRPPLSTRIARAKVAPSDGGGESGTEGWTTAETAETGETVGAAANAEPGRRKNDVPGGGAGAGSGEVPAREKTPPGPRERAIPEPSAPAVEEADAGAGAVL
jgi:predicted esterase